MKKTGIESESREVPGRTWKPVVALGLLLLLLVAGKVLPAKQWLQAYLEWTETLGPGAPVAFVGIYIVACVFLLPGSVLSLGAAVAFGFWKGLIAVSIGSTLGACAAFWVGRTVGREWVEAKVHADPRLRALDEAVGREGRRMVFLTRLSPIFPFNLLNYFYGVTRVGFLDYALASWIGMLPGTAAFVGVGGLGREVAGAATGARHPAQLAMYGVAVVATILVTVRVTAIARQALDQAIEGEE